MPWGCDVSREGCTGSAGGVGRYESIGSDGPSRLLIIASMSKSPSGRLSFDDTVPSPTGAEVTRGCDGGQRSFGNMLNGDTI